MKRTAPFLFFVFCCFFPAFSQDGPASGLLWEDDAYEQLEPFPAGARTGGKVKASLSPYAPPPGDQCYQQSCVGWAIACAMTTRWAYQCRPARPSWIEARRFSPACIYNQIKEGEDCLAGAYLTKGLKLAAEKGVCLLRSFPYECCCCSKLPTPAQRQEAGKYKIKGYQRLYGLNDSPEGRLQKTLYALDYHNPVIVALEITPDFKTLGAGQERWSPDREALAGGNVQGHALVVMGYDEETATITLLNSYGPGWGRGGTVEMSFSDFSRQARYGVVVSLGRWACE
ncbi:MAG: C1 family peptidase [Phaeodactylibacter sp.]|nr:C1 family peptidase [Phaeodactylibacter sp.]